MSLSFIGPQGSFERRWIVYALMRDNVQHHLEGGVPTPHFAAVHGLGEALSSGEVRVGARALRDELSRVEPLLVRPIADLAVSVRTRAVCALDLPLVDKQATQLVSTTEWRPPLSLAGAKTLGDVFGSLVSELRGVCDGAAEQDQLTVVDT